MPVADVKRRLRQYSDRARAAILRRFFKTGPGEYGEGDVFIGVVVPDSRKVANEYRDLPLREVRKLLRSPVHEERLTALIILSGKFRSGGEAEKDVIYRTYLSHAAFINNWDLVDLSAPQILGAFLQDRDRSELYALARSENVWERRMSVVATFHFIRKNDFKETVRIVRLLLNDREDLIHKACGWMLRETGKRNTKVLTAFLDRHYKKMPRTMLRYAIERLPEPQRKAYLTKKVPLPKGQGSV